MKQSGTIQARVIYHPLVFHKPAGTSRAVLREKPSWYIVLYHPADPGIIGIGECSLIPGLSLDATSLVELTLNRILTLTDLDDFQRLVVSLDSLPALRFALEMAQADLAKGGRRILYPSAFTRGQACIPINGLVWMDDIQGMKQQVKEKIEAGFTCIKLKIGALDYESELGLLTWIRSEYKHEAITLRVDANGAFEIREALEKIKRLADLDIHSIEQPIRPHQWEEMAVLCHESPIPIALDEELIGLHYPEEREALLALVRPQYLILKPSLLGGFTSCEGWISLAGKYQTGWWITSALESNIGLNAIAQWTYQLENNLPQGLGTGGLFVNNPGSPLSLTSGYLAYRPDQPWDLSLFQ